MQQPLTRQRGTAIDAPAMLNGDDALRDACARLRALYLEVASLRPGIGLLHLAAALAAIEEHVRRPDEPEAVEPNATPPIAPLQPADGVSAST